MNPLAPLACAASRDPLTQTQAEIQALRETLTRRQVARILALRGLSPRIVRAMEDAAREAEEERRWRGRRG